VISRDSIFVRKRGRVSRPGATPRVSGFRPNRLSPTMQRYPTSVTRWSRTHPGRYTGCEKAIRLHAFSLNVRNIITYCFLSFARLHLSFPRNFCFILCPEYSADERDVQEA
jgi:hypothetical protein